MPKPPHPHHHGRPHPHPNPRPHQPKDIPFATRLLDANNNFSLLVDGSAGAVDFTFVPADDLTVTELSLIFVTADEAAEDEAIERDAIDFGNRFIGQDGPLDNGIDIELQSYGQVIGASFKTTRDLLEYSSPAGFYTEEGIGSYVVKATRQFSQGLRLRDRYGDSIKLTVKDDLTKLGYGIASVLGYTD